MQEAFNAVERVPQPVIAAVHGACIGAGVDLISACDIRLCTEDVIYSIRVSSGWRTEVGHVAVFSLSVCQWLALWIGWARTGVYP